jgi:CHAT domain-containing protein/tetratricopeptide (TPR) repeat protein
VSIAGPALSGASHASAPATTLVEGLVLEREAAVGQTDRYSIELSAGQYLQVLVDQRGADVAGSLIGPDGVVVLETDTISGLIGPDPVAFIASTAGAHELRLTVLDVLPRGRYEIRVEAVREPTALDRLRVEAVKAGVEALRVSGQDLAAAVARFREAASAWSRLGERRLQMWMEFGTGTFLSEHLGRFEEARDATEHALAMALELRDDWAEALLRLQLGHCLRSLGRLEEGTDQCERALALHRAAGHQAEAGHVLATLGMFASQAGDAQEALDRLFEALHSFEAAGNTLYEALTRSLTAMAFLRLREPELALEQCRLALPVLVDQPSLLPAGHLVAERATCLTTMGEAHLELGDVARAREAFSEALTIWTTIGRSFGAVLTYAGMGDIHAAEGNLAAAREAYASALGRTGDDATLQGIVQCRRGEVELRLGDATAARTAFAAALAVAGSTSTLVAECAEAGLGRLARDAGDLSAARSHAQRAVDAGESIRAHLVSDQSRSALLASQQSRYELLIDVLMRQHERDPTHGHDAAAFDASERGRARSLLELLVEGGVDVRRGVDPVLLTEERSLRRRLNATAHAEAQAREAGRGDRANALRDDAESLVTRLGETEARIRRLSPQYAALTQPQPLTLADVRERVLDPQTQLLQYALGETRSYLWVVSPTSLRTFALASGTEIEGAARRAHELLSRPPAEPGANDTRARAEAALRELSRLLLAPAADALQGKRLVVVAPGVLQYVPFAALPWPDTGAMRASGGEPPAVLLSRFEVVSAPSASVIATLRHEAGGRPRAVKVAAVFADPVFESSDPRVIRALGDRRPASVPVASPVSGPEAPLQQALRGLRGSRGDSLGRLPFSRREAEVIAALAPAGRTLRAIGFEASRDAVVRPEIGEYGIVHFATHGVLNERRPELSGVVLSLLDRAGRSQDGFLRLHDVYNMQLRSDLVVLSGCQTALGREWRGEGLVGLSRGFMYAGAPRVVASLWQVDDESTAELMRLFYRSMLEDGRRAAEALRAAQLEMARRPRWSAPFYWAGFVLQGEWR